MRRLTRTPAVNSATACVFFFQAEDGIRDWSVTGVQTCALPIYLRSAGRAKIKSSERLSNPASRSVRTAAPIRAASWERCIHAKTWSSNDWAPRLTRSEERRVGKEGRARLEPYRGDNTIETGGGE